MVKEAKKTAGKQLVKPDMKVKANGEPTRAAKREERRRQAEELRRVLADQRGTHRPVQTRPITREDVEQIIEAVEQGDTIRGMCRQLGLSTVQYSRMLAQHQDLRERNERAIFERPNAWAEELIDIADEPIDELMYIMGSAQAEIAHRSLRINTRKNLMGKYNPRFADKQQVDVKSENLNLNANVDATRDVSSMTLQELTAELQQRHKRPRVD